MEQTKAAQAYKLIKHQKGERFARALRYYHSGILEIPNIGHIVRYAGRDATPLLPYLTSLFSGLAEETAPPVGDPFKLLAEAGYEAFHADTLLKQNSIAHYFAPGELLCTFDDVTRYQKYHIVHAVKKDAAKMNRQDFLGKEQRQDAYGTSVISIQMLKVGGFISIKNRYNHVVAAPDHTFNSNPNNIIGGLSKALKQHFKVDFFLTNITLPEGFTLLEKKIFRYHKECNNIYYGDQAWAEDGVVHEVDKAAGDALFEVFLFDNKSKMLNLIDPKLNDSFAYDFNRYYGGNRGLSVKNGNLVLKGKLLIETESARIKKLFLPSFYVMSERCISNMPFLTHAYFPDTTQMGDTCFNEMPNLEHAEFPVLSATGDDCFNEVPVLKRSIFPSLAKMGHNNFERAPDVLQADFSNLRDLGRRCFNDTSIPNNAGFPVVSKSFSFDHRPK